MSHRAPSLPARALAVAGLASALMVPPGAAQTTAPADFPAGAQAPSAEALHQRLRDRAFAATYANGTKVRFEFRANGYVFANASTGFNGSGPWRTEDGRLCTEIRGAPNSGCMDARIADDRLYYRRVNGEIVELRPG